MNVNDYEALIERRIREVLGELKAEPGVFPQRAKIRIELPIEDGTGQYIFDLKSQLVNNLTTFGLKRDDIVMPLGLGFLIGISHKVGGANGTEVTKLYSFAPKNDGVNPSVFPVGFVTDNIDNMYNGNVQWTVGTRVAWQAYAMENFKKVYRQYGAFVLDSDDQAVQECIPEEFNISEMIEPIPAKYYIAGTQEQQMTVNFPAANLTFALGKNTGDTNTYAAKLVLYMDVIKIQNGTKLLRVAEQINDNNPLVVSAWSAGN